MPIHRTAPLVHRPPRIGKIRLGKKVPNRNSDGEHPVETNYFVLPPDLLESPQFKENQEPTEITVYFPSDDIQKVFDPYYKLYNTANVMTVLCNGENCRRIDPATGAVSEVSCEHPDDPYEACACKAEPHGLLNVMLPTGLIGVYQIDIRGVGRVEIIESELAFFKNVFGRLAGIPFTLRRVPTKRATQKKEGGQKAGRMFATEGYPVHIIPHYSLDQVLEARGRGTLALPPATPLPPAPDLGEQDEPETVEAEATEKGGPGWGGLDAPRSPAGARAATETLPPPADPPQRGSAAAQGGDSRAPAAGGTPGDVMRRDPPLSASKDLEAPATEDDMKGYVAAAAETLGISRFMVNNYLKAVAAPGAITKGVVEEQAETFKLAVKSGQAAITALKGAMIAKVNQFMGRKG